MDWMAAERVDSGPGRAARLLTLSVAMDAICRKARVERLSVRGNLISP